MSAPRFHTETRDQIGPHAPFFLECHGCSPVVVVSTGLEDSTTGSVAETVASVLRGCLESMPKGESTTERIFMQSLIR